MSDPFLGEISTLAFDWAPRGYALCNGAQMSIQQNTALYALLGTQFGGDGRTYFLLPDLRGRVPVGIGPAPGGSNYNQGAAAGAEGVTLSIATVPAHTHPLNAATNPGNIGGPAGNLLSTDVPSGAAPPSLAVYRASGWTGDAGLNPASVASAGGNAAHGNMQPFAVVNFCIATQGNFPSRP